MNFIECGPRSYPGDSSVAIDDALRRPPSFSVFSCSRSTPSRFSLPEFRVFRRDTRLIKHGARIKSRPPIHRTFFQSRWSQKNVFFQRLRSDCCATVGRVKQRDSAFYLNAQSGTSAILARSGDDAQASLLHEQNFACLMPNAAHCFQNVTDSRSRVNLDGSETWPRWTQSPKVGQRPYAS